MFRALSVITHLFELYSLICLFLFICFCVVYICYLSLTATFGFCSVTQNENITRQQFVSLNIGSERLTSVCIFRNVNNIVLLFIINILFVTDNGISISECSNVNMLFSDYPTCTSRCDHVVIQNCTFQTFVEYVGDDFFRSKIQ